MSSEFRVPAKPRTRKVDAILRELVADSVVLTDVESSLAESVLLTMTDAQLDLVGAITNATCNQLWPMPSEE